MKKTAIALVILVVTACKDEKRPEVTENPDKKTTESIVYPYSAAYSSDISMGDPNHSKIVLDFIKLWEENKVKEMRPLLADTLFCLFENGTSFNGTADSLLNMGETLRKKYSTVKVIIDSWLPVHFNDKNEDYVLVWEKDFNTQGNRTDSIYSHTSYRIADNKIRGWTEFRALMSAPK